MCKRTHYRDFAALAILVVAPAIACAKNSGKNETFQLAVKRAMAGRPGTFVVADVRTGEILAALGMEVAAHRLERPGSTVKPFVLMALLESGKLNASQKLICRRPLRIGGVKMDCTHPTSIADLNAEEAIAYSCNSYFAEVATRLSQGEFVQALRRAGLDAPSSFVGDEARGHIEPPVDREMLQLEALGDRGIAVTPLELLEAYRKLALQRRSGVAQIDEPVFGGLEKAVTYGMAHAAYVENMKVAGKTGTAGARATVATHGFFVGYAPADKPEIVLVVFLERGHGGDAAAVARPVFAEFALGRSAP